MSELLTLYKQDGTKVNVNDNSLATALSLGWTEENPKAEKQVVEKQVVEKQVTKKRCKK